ncbi:MAG: Exodeoxyribonuclease VII, large subunit [Methanomicrobiales archaeon 53_19]|jgi:exodeoxyribonuclease VII large subunit|nr:MAG: Exodeoxyribonuclease VII, large subunit [Methanocalculus sp. 52_23]KUL04830.1 MAG: Exodeoxyribonuclease VII, large subunit [Methanomicrobiales archaeon 53_19]HIJ06077.1 exodeoxyribonuclease VII large subunit [Methanocalculus sp.]
MPGGEQAVLVTDDPEIITVQHLTRIIREELDTPLLRDISVRGEVTNYRLHSSGHMYFTLSEKNSSGDAAIDCVIWRRAALRVSPPPENGMDVIVHGYVDFYPPHGRTRFIGESLIHAGAGEKYIILERWKRELSAEGCFAPETKKPIPQYPVRVGVVTSPTGAVLQDIRNVLSRRFPLDLIISPTQVQGEYAHMDIAEAIRRIDGHVDVIILARGGGSFEDLFPFNHPDVIRAIVACRTPIVSAIGHEVDVTLADLASDLRAPTPSAAAELVVCDRVTLLREHAERKATMQNLILDRLEKYSRDLEEIRLRIQGRRIERRISDMKQATDDLRERLQKAISRRLIQEKSDLARYTAEIRSADLRAPLSKGYALLLADGEMIRSVDACTKGDPVTIYLIDGEMEATITEVRHDRDL